MQNGTNSTPATITPDPKGTDEQQNWTPDSWRSYKTLHQPVYPDEAKLNEALTYLSGLTPLVTSWEVQRLKEFLGEAALGKRFLLQGGDCAESFNECSSDIITSRLKVLLQMSLVLIYGLQAACRTRGAFCRPVCKATVFGNRNH